ncbi:MAG TPA: acetyl-CoA hydrolase/transferase C-terminal domain-containing protein [Anaerolineaceae bacterium]|nr:acetyl-CoA hydrolase/transferase C-terminal domain-containing protein [Anaerolineaceae bacterium]HQF45962.1 acetyl-CoA hydrolase/transferase C-terminal domain-containing protein [Anaerolineaceae bacterium]HQH36037.1 acetyl-CoA hydrolase/transferase C-terminal domain-containing protein [Anaerolineaceae bacterium]HQJ03384.1 acetyl-CoA hydrolase/transferase C-terminal domain-containing protein [Anaerolineaceae bacterium]
MDWKQYYQSHRMTALEAVRLIKSGDRVFLTGNCSVPLHLLSALVEYAPNLQNVELCQALTVAGSEYVSPEMEGHLRVNSFFVSHNVRKAIHEGRADFTPVLLSEFPLLFQKGILSLDVALVHISPPDEDGYCRLGIEAGLTRSQAESAKLVIAQVNKQMPSMMGDTLFHVTQLGAIVEVDEPLAELPMTNDTDHQLVQRIAGFIAERIPDGATLQLGIGGIPDAVLGYLYEKKDLGIHSELFSDGVIDLVEKGIINGSRKTIHTGKITAGFILGTRRLYDWVHNNPLIEIRRTEYVNNPFIIAQNKNMVAINSAIEIDLTGQVCSDSIGTKIYSGVGGQMDFIYGASLSDGGLPIIALPSTTTLKDGTIISRIVPMLKPGAGVVTSRNHVHYIATEYGMVDLYGKTIRQRTQALISIAHPDFRDDLTAQAKQLNYI